MNLQSLYKLEDIHDNPFQGRTEYTDIEPLGRSIATDDLKEFPRARMNGKGVQLQFGHRRREAFKWLKANWKKEGLTDRYEGYTVMPLFIDDLSDDAMFRSAVIENEHRKKLNPIEQAEMMRVYRDQFGKNSDEIGALFGMNGATVRGMTRLLDLHPAAQEALAEGKITQGTARSLLSMAKVANEKAIEQTLKRIDERKDEQLPDDVIELSVDRLSNVVDMGNFDGKEKPRAGYKLWLLDMKNFPNNMLPPITDLSILGIEKGHSNEILAARYIKGEDAYVPEDLKAKIDHLLNPPPACTACPFYAVINKSHYCGVKACHERKKVAFKAQQIADMSRTLKIAVYASGDGRFISLDHHTPSHKTAFDARHADLRLVPHDALKNSYIWQDFRGANQDIAYIVAVGDLANKIATRGSKGGGGKKTEKEKAEMRAMRQYRAVRRELVWEYTKTAQRIFEGVPMDVLQSLRKWKFVGIDDRIPDEYDHPKTGTAAEQLEFARRDLVWALVIGETSHDSRGELTDYLDAFAELTGVKAPKPLIKQAQEWDAEIHALAKVSVAVETLRQAQRDAKGKKK